MSKDRRIATNRSHSTMTTSVECRGTTLYQCFKIVNSSKAAKHIIAVHFIYLPDRSSHGGGATDGGGYHPCYYSSQQQFASDYVMSQQAGLNGGNLVGGGNGPHEVALCTASGCRQTSHNTRQMAPGGVAGTVDHLHNNSQNQARTLGLLVNSLLKECKNHPN